MVTLCGLLTALTHGLASRTLLPNLFRPRIDATLVRPLLRFGSGVIVSALLGFMLTNVERLLLAHFASVRDLAYYSIAASLAGLVALIPSSMNQPLLPALSALHAAKDHILLERLCMQALRAVLFCVLPAALMICAAGEPLLRVWAGPDFAAHSTIPLYILMVGVVFNIMATVPFNLLTASGRTGTIALCHLVETIPYIICASLLTIQFGVVGAAVAWSLRTLLDCILLFASARKVAGLPLRVFLRNWRIYGIVLLILVGAALASFSLGGNPFVRMAIAAAGCAGYCGVVWRIILSPAERKSLLRILSPRSETQP
jgi:O-antigen/teichoic acid export membrane protein